MTRTSSSCFGEELGGAKSRSPRVCENRRGDAESSVQTHSRGDLVRRGVGGALSGRSSLLPLSTHLERAEDVDAGRTRLEQQREAIWRRREALLLEEVEIEVKLHQLRKEDRRQA